MKNNFDYKSTNLTLTKIYQWFKIFLQKSNIINISATFEISQKETIINQKYDQCTPVSAKKIERKWIVSTI